MEELNKGVTQDIKIITYFKIKNTSGIESSYVLYNYNDAPNNIYISNAFRDGEVIKLIKPSSEILPELKRIIENLISNTPNSFIFSQNKYQYIDINFLTTKQVEKIDSQKIQLTEQQYNNMMNSRYLMYPYGNLLNIKPLGKSNNKYNPMADTISIVVSSILLLLIIGGLSVYQFDWDMFKDGVFNIDSIMTHLLTFTLYINNYLILKLAIVSFIFVLISYKTEKTRPILTWFIITLLSIIVYSLWYKSKGYIDFNDEFFNFLKGMTIFGVFISLVFTISHVLVKEITTLITEKFSFCNFITYYTIYFILFTSSFIGLGLFYNNYLLEHVQEFVTKIMS